MFTAIIDQLGLRDKELLIFSNSHWKEILYVVLSNAGDYTG